MMWDKPSINRLPGERLHLRHGPIAIVLKVWADDAVVRQAHRLVTRHFPKILLELTDVLPTLRTPLKKRISVDGKVAQSMVDAALPFADVYVTPMAAVAGAVADEVLRILRAAGPIEKAYVNDGGDIALHLEEGQSLKFGVAGDFSAGQKPSINGTISIEHAHDIGGIATSGSHGKSFSLGIADSVTVLAKTAAAADVAATLVANAVDVDSKAVTRKPANKLDPDTDLGSMPVTTKVGKLSQAEIDAALDAGLARAERYLSDGLIAGAVLMLQGGTRVVGRPVAQIEVAKAAGRAK
ncbi:MAG TPA: UPF0280 family protein [Hyphomicrobiaceae bacterium]|nr:UPF0280 family protein [Hyphomicrobiaceae bacterium]